MSTEIHPSSVIEKGAILGNNVKIGPFCYIGANVEIGEGTSLRSHIVINGYTKIGKDNQIYQFSSIGEVNQDLKYRGEPTRTEIGDRNLIRESVTIHRGTVQGTGTTRVGSDNLLMVNTHIAHDCQIGNRCILANNATLGGHVVLDDYVIVGGVTAIHQFCVVGAHAMIGGATSIVQDVPPFVMAQGNRAVPYGVNYEGLKRRGFSKEEQQIIGNTYNLLYRKGLLFKDAKEQIETMAKNTAALRPYLPFFERSTRGIIRP